MDEDNLGPIPDSSDTSVDPGEAALAQVQTPMPMPDPGQTALSDVQNPAPTPDPGQTALAQVQGTIQSEIKPGETLPQPPLPTDASQQPTDFERNAAILAGVPGFQKPAVPMSLASNIVADSPLGIGANLVNAGTGVLGAGMNELGNLYKTGAGPLAPNLTTPLEKMAAIEQIPETAVKKSLLGLESMYPEAYQNIQAIRASGQTPTWENVFNNVPGAEQIPQNIRSEIAKDMGIIGEPLLDPMWKVHMGGLTDVGEEARLKGLVQPNFGKAVEAGQKGVLTVGNTSVLPGAIERPIANAIGGAQTGIRNMFPGLHTMTENPEFNMMAEQNKISPMSEANVQTDQIHAYMKDLLDRNSQKLGISPEELSQRMMDWREPAGSQMPFMGHTIEDLDEAGNLQERIPTDEETAQQQAARQSILQLGRKTTEQGLTPEIINHLKTSESANQIYGDVEGQAKRDYYLYHTMDPQAQQWLKDNFNELPGQGGPSGKPGATFNPSDIDRAVATRGMTAREANNFFAQGRGGELYPAFADQMNNYKGPWFSEDMANIEASRFLHNRQVGTSYDLMNDAGKAYGKTTQALSQMVGGTPGAMKDWVAVNHPAFDSSGGHLWFPKPIGDYLNGIDMAKDAQPVNPFLNQSNKAVKFFNFGLWPGSAFKNYASNLSLGMRGGMTDGPSIIDGGKTVFRMNRDNPELQFLGVNKAEPLGDDVVLHSPKYGDVTSQQLIDQANANRGIGMGPARAASTRPLEEEGWLNNPVTRKMYAIHNFAEDSSRLPIFMKALKDGATWEGAGKISRDTAFDYGNMGPTDQFASKYIPFYRFMRNNVPSILGNMVTNPARTLAAEKAREAWNKANDAQDESTMTQFTRAGAPLYMFTDQGGQKHYLKTSTFDPTTDINRFVGESKPGSGALQNTAKNFLDYGTSGLTPFIGGVYNAIENNNPTYNTPIDKMEANGLSTPEMKESIPGLPLTAREDYALRQFRPFSETAGVVGSNPNLQPWERGLKLFTGVSISPNDAERGQISNEYGQKRTLRNDKSLLRFYGRQAEEAGEQGDQNRSDIQNQNEQNAQTEIEGQFNPGEDALRQLQNK